MKRWLILLPRLVLSIAYFTKPDDKTCIIGGVKAVWGNMVPDPYAEPGMFENFMNITSVNVRVRDWIFFKQVKYRVTTDEKTVAFGVFKNVLATVKPVEFNLSIPKMK